MGRKQISKKMRFEVFKRDGFQCQYCGASAPETILHVDHIKPVSDGGENDLLNLITSCVDCNLGKGARPLDDNAAIQKQRRQLEELNERRQQLEMLLEWKDGLQEIEQDQIEVFRENLRKNWTYDFNETGERKLRRWIKKYSFQEVWETLDKSFNQYSRYEDGKITAESWNKAFEMIPRIINMDHRGGMKEEDKQLYYIRGILRNRVYVNEKYIMRLLRDVRDANADMNSIQDIACTCRNWTEFRDTLEDFIEEHGED